MWTFRTADRNILQFITFKTPQQAIGFGNWRHFLSSVRASWRSLLLCRLRLCWVSDASGCVLQRVQERWLASSRGLAAYLWFCCNWWWWSIFAD